MSNPTELKPVPTASRKGHRKCLLILGMHRSGTSAIARAINLLGPDMPRNLLGAERFNRAGHWEPERIVAVNDELLAKAGSRWDDWREFDTTELPNRELTRYEDWLKRLIGEEFDESSLFVLKDPRICRMVPLYEKMLATYRIDPVCILPFRNPLEVCQSLARRDDMTIAYAGFVWLRHVLDAEYASRSLERTFINFNTFSSDPVAALSQVTRDLDTEFPKRIADVRDEILASMRDELQHHQVNEAELNAHPELPDWVKATYKSLLQLETDPGHSEAKRTLDTIRTAFNEASVRLGQASFGEFLRREQKYLTETRRLADELREAQTGQRLREELSKALEQANQNIKHLSDVSEGLVREVEAARKERIVLADSLQTTRDRLARTAARLSVAEAGWSEAKAGHDKARADAAHWEHRFVESHEAHSRELLELTSSTSWRITRPLRGLKRAVTERGFAGRLARSAGKRVLFLLPLPARTKTGLVTRYHQWRMRNSIPAPALATPQPVMQAASPVQHQSTKLPELPFAIPDDGRWNIEAYEDARPALAAYVAALSRGFEEGPLWESDLSDPVAQTGPLTSLIVRTYKNRGALLSKALESIEKQTYRPIEVLVVEDGGSDMLETVRQFDGAEGITFRHIACKKLGRSNSANEGLKAAHGEFIGFLDDDDFLMPDHVARLSGCLQARSDFAAAYSAALEIGADIDPKSGTMGQETENAVFFRPLASSANLVNRNAFPIQSVLFRAEICTADERFDLNLNALEDWLFWMRLLVGHRVVGLTNVTSAFYVPASRQAHKKRIDAHIAAEPYFIQQRKAFFESRRLTSLEPIKTDITERHSHAVTRSFMTPQPGERPPATIGTGRLAAALGSDTPPDLRPLYAPRIVAYTSINLRYLPKALAWARSVKAQNPDWETHILLNDAVPEDAGNWPNVDVVYPIAHLGVPNFQSWAFRMRVVELCTATKPFYARKLLDAGYDHVFYFDPDTYAYSDLNKIIAEFDEDDVLITPHCAEDATSEAEIHYNEMSSLAHGVFNLGFLGLRNTETAHRVVDFWCRRLLRHCEDDHGRGLFTDQKWFNLVPVFFDKVKVLKHKGCNTASWNIAHRSISEEGEQLKAGGEDLIFFHFSGYDRNTPRAMFDIFGQFNPVLSKMIDAYDEINEQFSRQFPVCKSDWALGTYDNGEKIEDTHRELYRIHYEYQLTHDTPYQTGPHSFRAMLAKIGAENVRKRTTPDGFIRRHF